MVFDALDRRALLTILLQLAPAAFAADPPRQVLEQGPVRVTVEPRHPGMTIEWDGIAISTGSELVATTPPWTPHYYVGPEADAVPRATVENVEGQSRLRMTHRGNPDAFFAEETITVFPDGRIEQILEGHFSNLQGEALLQWRIAGLSAAVFAGRPYEATLRDGTTTKGIVPWRPVPESNPGATVAKGATSTRLDSRIGPVVIDIESDRDLTLYDFRRGKWADPENPIFWFGDLGTRIRAGQAVRYKVTWRLPSIRVADTGRAVVHVKAEGTYHRWAQYIDRDGYVELTPRPKSANFLRSTALALDPRSIAVVFDQEWQAPEGGPGGIEPLAAPAWRELQDGWERLAAFRIAGPDATEDPEIEPARSVRFVGARGPLVIPPEGYALIVRGDDIEVAAGDAPGFRHAMRTLFQLSEPGRSSPITIRQALVADWPSLPFRGVHLFTGGRGTDLHERLIRDVIAALKFNHVVLESEYIEWDSHPEIHHPQYGMSKADARKVIQLCRAQGIEPIPLVQSLGHAQWMFTNDRNLDLAEDPEAKWAYCVTNPKTYDFIFDVYKEALDLFAPKYVHIGHDEVADRGRYPFREESRKHTVEELLMMDTLRLHDWFAQRGVATMMWGDMLLGPGEAPDACHARSVESAADLRARLPKDIVITDWHYAAAEPQAFVNFQKFRDSGQRTIAASWHRPANITSLARAAFDNKSMGLLQTTWAGYSLDAESFERERKQYEAWVLAAEAAWNADNPPNPATYRAGWRFLDLMGLSSLKPVERAGTTLDIIPACNVSLTRPNDAGWPGIDLDANLHPERLKEMQEKFGATPDVLPQGDLELTGCPVRFRPIPGVGNAALLLEGKLAAGLNLPHEVKFDLEHVRADHLAFLHVTNFPAKRGTPIARYEVEFEDGRTAAIDAVYGVNVVAHDDFSAVADAPAVWEGVSRSDDPIALRVLLWNLPRSGQRINTLTIRSLGTAPSLMVFGVTALEE